VPTVPSPLRSPPAPRSLCYPHAKRSIGRARGRRGCCGQRRGLGVFNWPPGAEARDGEDLASSLNDGSALSLQPIATDAMELERVAVIAQASEGHGRPGLSDWGR
jgi:hypothetical protein